MDDSLIDNDLTESPKDVVIQIMRWWEKKRLLFNLIMVLMVILSATMCFYERPNKIEYIVNIRVFIQSLLFFILINLCYCAGWGVQLLGYYYFKIQYDSNALDYAIFIIGSLFTALVTIGYIEYIIYSNRF